MNKLEFFKALPTRYPELVAEGKKIDSIVTRANIHQMLDNNKMYGIIETGGAYWLASFISPKFYGIDPVMDEQNSNLCRYIRHLTEISEGISCYPMEKTIEIYEQRISEISTHLHQMHGWLMKGAE